MRDCLISSKTTDIINDDDDDDNDSDYIYFSAYFHEEFVKVFKHSILRCLGLHAIDDVVHLRFQCVTLCRQSFIPFHDYLKPLSEDIY